MFYTFALTKIPKIKWNIWCEYYLVENISQVEKCECAKIHKKMKYSNHS